MGNDGKTLRINYSSKESWIPVGLFFILIIMQIIHWLESHLLVCPYKQFVGYDCPGCGMQRSFIELLKGNFGESFHFYPALLPIIFTLLLTATHLIFGFKNGANYIKYSFMITMGIIIISYLTKLFL